MIDVRVNDRKKPSVGGGGEGAEEGDEAHRNRPTENQEPLRPNGFFFIPADLEVTCVGARPSRRRRR